MDRRLIVLLVVGAVAVGLLILLLIGVFRVNEDGGSSNAPLPSPAAVSGASLLT